MRGLPLILLFTAMTFLSWGAYGPTLHHGTKELANDSLRAFVGVGLAYFLIAVLIPIFFLYAIGEKGRWTISGSFISVLAGAVGAIGALGVILALGNGGKAIYVMPLVFGFAPVVNTLVTASLNGSFRQIRPIFIAGIITASLGAVGVLVFKPAASPAVHSTTEEIHSESETAAAVPTEAGTESQSDAPEENPGAQSDTPPIETTPEAASTQEAIPAADPAPSNSQSSRTGVPQHSGESAILKASFSPPVLLALTNAAASATNESEASGVTATSTTEATGGPAPGSGVTATSAGSPAVQSNYATVVLSIFIAALCWGAYGPFLHLGQARMAGSRMRPFACVGFAYFIIAVAAPLALIQMRETDNGAWTTMGMSWSILAGTAGAVGALGVILAFNAGGKPFYVMPLIFGFAPVINTFITLTEADAWSRVTLPFWISLAVVITGAVIVLTNAPKPAAPKPTGPSGVN